MRTSILFVLVACSSLVAADPDIDLEPRLLHDEVVGEDITVKVSWWTLTGTTHVADELVFTTAKGTLQLKHDEESGIVLPLVEQIHRAGKDRWVVLGWSSYGEGMQTQHAWLVAGGAKPRIVDKLEWTTDRRHGGLVIDPGDKLLRVGIPLPERASTTDDDEDALHNELDWQLVHGKRTRTLAQVAKLPAQKSHLMAVRAYTPPFHASASDRGWSGHFVWFTAKNQFARSK